MRVLIVRLGALGDIIHAIPAAAALRAAFPDARVDWLVERKHREIVDLVTVIDNVVVLERPSLAGWVDISRRLRPVGYDAAIDLQGLLKSAVLARASGARRVLGFSVWHLREKSARPFYSTTDDGFAAGGARDGSGTAHVISKNLRLLRALDVHDERITFPLATRHSDAVVRVREAIRRGAPGPDRPFALINPGAAWPNKRWAAERFGEIATFLRDVRGLPSFVLWGPGEEPLAQAVVEASSGAASVAPRTGLVDLLELARAAALMVSGDTGPLHIATAAGTPSVAIFGPTDPVRNGPWSAADVTISRFASCVCHYERRCRGAAWCLDGVSVAEVTAGIQQRLQSS